MKKTTETNSSDSQILSRSEEEQPLETLLDLRNQFDEEDSFYLDNLVDSRVPFDSRSLLNYGDSADFEDLLD
jgi:hypothetical protein